VHGAREVDQVDAVGAGRLPALRGAHGVVAVDGLLGEVAALDRTTWPSSRSIAAPGV